MKRGDFKFNKNLAILVNSRGQFIYFKRQFINIRYKKQRFLSPDKKFFSK